MGYFPKRIEPRPDWLKAPSVIDICSVSECVSEGPPDWINQWRHNEWWLYNSVQEALSVVPPAESDLYTMFAYRFEAAIYDGGKKETFDLPDFDIDPLSSDATTIGFDVVSRSCGSTFECSPLSCNHMAEEIVVNPHCLLDTYEKAIEIALRFSIEEPEPGPFFVAEVILLDR